jgi:hypothetical protein
VPVGDVESVMGLISIPEARRAGPSHSLIKTAKASLRATLARASALEQWDIFLSHSYADVTVDDSVLMGLREILGTSGYTVYIDWINDEELDRSKVTAATAERLKARMGQCRSLLFATSESSSKSIWMPWELGYSDGHHGKAAILPLAAAPTTSETYAGQEYLGIYPYLVQTGSTIYIHRDNDTFLGIDRWLNGETTWTKR